VFGSARSTPAACLFLEKGIGVETLVAQIKAVCRDPSPV